MSLRDHLLSSPAFQARPWQTYHVKDSDKGPMVWEAKRVTITLKDENDLPGLSLELVAARDVRDREKVKYFVSNAAGGDSHGPVASGGADAVARGAPALRTASRSWVLTTGKVAVTWG